MKTEAEERFTHFALQEAPALSRLALFLTGDRERAQDLVQTALTRLYVAWPRVESSNSTAAYVRRVMVNSANDAHRFRARRVREHTVDSPPELVDLNDPAELVASADRVRRLLASLPPRQRAVVALRFGEDLSERETAAVLGISVGTVKSHTARAISRLRAIETTTEEVGHVTS